jgi:hypothetical protein
MWFTLLLLSGPVLHSVGEMIPVMSTSFVLVLLESRSWIGLRGMTADQHIELALTLSKEVALILQQLAELTPHPGLIPPT